jgi:hypothetical protein
MDEHEQGGAAVSEAHFYLFDVTDADLSDEELIRFFASDYADEFPSVSVALAFEYEQALYRNGIARRCLVQDALAELGVASRAYCECGVVTLTVDEPEDIALPLPQEDTEAQTDGDSA